MWRVARLIFHCKPFMETPISRYYRGNIYDNIIHCWFTIIYHIYAGWCFGTFGLFFHILGTIIPFDFHIFQRGRSTTNQLWHLKQAFLLPICRKLTGRRPGSLDGRWSWGLAARKRWNWNALEKNQDWCWYIGFTILKLTICLGINHGNKKVVYHCEIPTLLWLQNAQNDKIQRDKNDRSECVKLFASPAVMAVYQL
jgi:hypothetical protein